MGYELLTIFRKTRVKQISALYASMITGIFVGIIVSVLNTRLLGPERFGDFRFIHSAYSFFALILAFGFLVTSSKMLAEKKNENIRKEIIGASLIINSVIGFVFIGVMIVFGIFQKHFFANDLSRIIIYVSPLMFFVPFIHGMENLYQGENRIYELSLFRQIPQILYIPGILILFYMGRVSVITALYCQLLIYGAVIIAGCIRLRPQFSELKTPFKQILYENRIYGFNVYIGSLIGVASTQFGPLAISFFSDTNISVGYYSLALTITMPLAMIPSVVGTAMFKEFANRKNIPARATFWTVLISAVSLTAFLFFVKPLVTILYSDQFINAVKLAYIVSAGQIFHGFGNYYNRFLGSKGQGKSLRNGAMVVGVVNLIGFMTLVPKFGAEGAAFTKLASGIVFLGSMFFYYKRYIHK